MSKQMLGAAVGAALAAFAGSAHAGAETVRTEVFIAAKPHTVWAAVRDVYAVDKRLVPGLVVKAERDGDSRIVTFANGYVVKERIVTIDDEDRRIAYSAFGGRATYHMASMQVVAEGRGSRVIWVTDFLPAELKPFIKGNMDQGMSVMKQTLERGPVQ